MSNRPGTQRGKQGTQWPRLGPSIALLSLGLMVGCVSAPANLHPPVVVLGPAPTLDELVRAYEENCAALRAIRGEDPKPCLMQ